jgi:hypothetical protein
MPDCAAANITIGGIVTREQFTALCGLIADADLRIEWGGAPFDPARLPQDDALRLFAEAAPWGEFDDLEQYCCDQTIAYQRWSASCPGSFGAERIVHDGKAGPLNFAADEDDRLVVHAQTIEQLGSMRAIRRYIRQAEVDLPSFTVADGP